MLNNKKSLLQRARIAMAAIVVILGIGGAYAMTPHVNKDAMTYGVVGTVGNNYKVTDASLGGCNESFPSEICKVSSTATPDPVTHLIPKTGATTVANGRFTQ